MGKTIIDWATIIAPGVYNKSKTPSGAPLANIKYTISPTTTGGMPIRELKIMINKFFKKNFFNANKYPKIKAKKEDMTKAIRLTFNDKKIISINIGSKPIINFTELKNISKIFINKYIGYNDLTF